MANILELQYATDMEEIVVSRLNFAHAADQAAKIIFGQLVAAQFFSVPSVLLLSGGSVIAVVKSLLLLFPPEVSLTNITFALADERFVPIDSKDSNAVQLADAGVIDLIKTKGGTFLPLLHADTLTAKEVASQANTQYEKIIKAAEKVILLAGIGADGHTTGILPHKNSTDFQMFSNDAFIVAYQIPQESNNPYKNRITTTLAALSFVDTVFLFATGDEKKAALTDFTQKNKPMHEVPALALYLSQQPVQILTSIEL